MARVEGSDLSRGAAIPDLHLRMQRAARGLGDGADLHSSLSELLHVIGVDCGIERLIVAVGGEEPRVLAAYPGPIASLDTHARLADLVHRVHTQSDNVVERTASPGVGREGVRARVGVPMYREGRIMAVLVGETAPQRVLEEVAEVALEAMATLLTPLLLVHGDLESARELDRLRSDFISRISHELRTPLTIITGFAGTLGAHEDTLTAEQRHAMLDRIVTASVRLEHLVEEVLALASVDAGLADPKPRLLPVRDVVDLAVHDRGGADRVEVRDPSSLRLLTDPEIARVVLGSLVENALQHGGRVTVTVEAVGDGARVLVEDDGPGVPPELGTRVFERFVRGDDRSPGMGLGLAIARRMVALIGGHVWHEEVPVGARFVAQLPTMQPSLRGR